MKRISLFAIAMLATVPGITKASGYYSASQYRVRWSPYTHGLVTGDIKYSPYAYQRGSSGLIYRRMKYSPYAKQYGNTGLVHDNVRYSPYAFGFNRSGLVADPWGGAYDYQYARPHKSPGPCVVVYNSKSPSYRPSVNRSTRVYAGTNNNPRAKLAARKAKVEQLKRRRDQIQTAREYNGKDIISAYLRLKNIDFRTNRTLSIENKLISIDFILTDKNIIIKYWNPEAILALKQQQNKRIRSYERYLVSYKEYCNEYLNNGGRIYQIITADHKEVLVKLIDYKQLEEKPELEDRTIPAQADENLTVMARAD